MKIHKKGFTLTELLIVIAIVAVLAAIGIPIFNVQLERIRLSVDHANIRTVESMMSVANQTNEIVADGVTMSLEDAKAHVTETGAQGFALSKDGTLITLYSSNYEDAYLFQATGTPSNSACPDCPRDTSIHGGYAPLNRLHITGQPIHLDIIRSGETYTVILGISSS